MAWKALTTGIQTMVFVHLGPPISQSLKLRAGSLGRGFLGSQALSLPRFGLLELCFENPEDGQRCSTELQSGPRVVGQRSLM